MSEQRVDAAAALVEGRLGDLTGQSTRRVRSQEELRVSSRQEPDHMMRREHCGRRARAWPRDGGWLQALRRSSDSDRNLARLAGLGLPSAVDRWEWEAAGTLGWPASEDHSNSRATRSTG